MKVKSQAPSIFTYVAKASNVFERSVRKKSPVEKIYPCDVCGNSFGYKHVLQNHMLIHTGKKPFGCESCGKRFTRDHHLKTHMRLHTGEKPYECETCKKRFVQVANLRSHLRVYKREAPVTHDPPEQVEAEDLSMKKEPKNQEGGPPVHNFHPDVHSFRNRPSLCNLKGPNLNSTFRINNKPLEDLSLAASRLCINLYQLS